MAEELAWSVGKAGVGAPGQLSRKGARSHLEMHLALLEGHPESKEAQETQRSVLGGLP